MYDLRFDADTGILHVSAEGFWTMSTLASFAASGLARTTALRFRHGEFAILNDARRFPIQSREVARGLELLMGRVSKVSSAPSASVVGSTLAKLQAERVVRARNSRVFLDWDEAHAWLQQEWSRSRAA